MFITIIKTINPIDVLLLVVSLRVAYIGWRRGLLVEIFKLAGILVAAFVTLHYYASLARVTYFLFALPRNTVDLLAFLLLWLMVVTVFKLLREGVVLLAGKAQGSSKSGGGSLTALFVSLVRAALVGSLLFVGLMIIDKDPATKSARQAFSKPIWKDTAIIVYEGVYYGIISRIFPDEEFNDKVLKLKRATMSVPNESITSSSPGDV